MFIQIRIANSGDLDQMPSFASGLGLDCLSIMSHKKDAWLKRLRYVYK